MSAHVVVMLVAATPLLAAVVCRLDDFTRDSMSILSALVTWAIGCAVAWVVLWSFDAPPGPLSWSTVAAGWLWIMGTWAFRPGPVNVKG